jgi:hypothetical protein
MKNPFIVKPTGLKGVDKLNRMKELMGSSLLNEDVKNSVVELTKLGPDGKVYGIVREGHNYFIKVTNKKSNILTEDFNYIGGLMNKTSEVYPSYAKALKQLNLKFISLNEAYGKTGNFNIFEDDNLLNEHHPYNANQKLSATKGMGDGAEYIVDKKGSELSYDAKEGKEEGQFGDNVAEKDVEDEFEKVKLSENEMAIDSMLSDDEAEEFIPHGTYTVSNHGGFEIMLSDDGDAAKVRDAFGSDNPKVSDWLEIQYDENGDPVIDPNGYNIPLNMVMRINENKRNNKFSISKAIDLMEDIVDETDRVSDILNSLTESEKKALLNTLKKKV